MVPLSRNARDSGRVIQMIYHAVRALPILARDGDRPTARAGTGGPAITEVPVLKGFGSRLTARSISGQLGGQLDFDWQESGLVVTIRMPQERLAR